MNRNPEISLLLQSFERNGRVNSAVLNAISEQDLELNDGQGGWNIGQHIGHQAEFRYGWLSQISPIHAEKIPSVADTVEGHPRLTMTNLGKLNETFLIADGAALAAVLSALDEGRLFEKAYQSHPAHFLQHILIHDAHHRGQVISRLRKHGWTTAQLDQLDDNTWTIWRE
jgi:uncharacterized damage-inducible protein DinB